MIAYVFPGQAAQFIGMGQELYNQSESAKVKFEQANDILGFSITDIMFGTDAELLKQTVNAQPALFAHSVISYLEGTKNTELIGVAGHSLGEFSSLVAAEVLSFEAALVLVQKRAEAMQECCESNPGTMAAIVGLADEKVEEICADVEGTVVAANYNCPGQLVISGEIEAVNEAAQLCKEAGAKMVVSLAVSGAFHSPLMLPAQKQLESAIVETDFKEATVPVYQNVNAAPIKDALEIKKNLIAQLSSPVLWTKSIQKMIFDGVEHFVECGGNGKVLRGMIKRIDRSVATTSI